MSKEQIHILHIAIILILIVGPLLGLGLAWAHWVVWWDVARPLYWLLGITVPKQAALSLLGKPFP